MWGMEDPAKLASGEERRGTADDELLPPGNVKKTMAFRVKMSRNMTYRLISRFE